jgi:hypothetical protein
LAILIPLSIEVPLDYRLTRVHLAIPFVLLPA